MSVDYSNFVFPLILTKSLHATITFSTLYIFSYLHRTRFEVLTEEDINNTVACDVTPGRLVISNPTKVPKKFFPPSIEH
jgi:hypothetical protein